MGVPRVITWMWVTWEASVLGVVIAIVFRRRSAGPKIACADSDKQRHWPLAERTVARA